MDKKKREIQKKAKKSGASDFNYSGVERLNSIPDYSKLTNENLVSKVIGKYSVMTSKQLVKASKDPHNTLLETQVISMILKSLKSKDALSITKYLHDRLDGKVKERVEHSGPNSKPIEISSTTMDLSKLNKEDLLALKSVVSNLKKIKSKVVVDESE